MAISLFESFRQWGRGPDFLTTKESFATFAATLDKEHCFSAYGIADSVGALTIQQTTRYDYEDCREFSKAVCRNLYNKAFKGEIESYARGKLKIDKPVVAGQKVPPLWLFYQYRATDFAAEALAVASDWPDKKLAGLFLDTLQKILSGQHQEIKMTVDGIPEDMSPLGFSHVIKVEDFYHGRRTDLHRVKTPHPLAGLQRIMEFVNRPS